MMKGKTLSTIYHDLLASVIAALEAKDHFTADHSMRVSNMTEKTCMELNLSLQQSESIHMAAHVHDIGKIGVPEIHITPINILFFILLLGLKDRIPNLNYILSSRIHISCFSMSLILSFGSLNIISFNQSTFLLPSIIVLILATIIGLITCSSLHASSNAVFLSMRRVFIRCIAMISCRLHNS